MHAALKKHMHEEEQNQIRLQKQRSSDIVTFYEKGSSNGNYRVTDPNSPLNVFYLDFELKGDRDDSTLFKVKKKRNPNLEED